MAVVKKNLNGELVKVHDEMGERAGYYVASPEGKLTRGLGVMKMIELKPTGKYYLFVDLHKGDIDPSTVRSIEDLERFKNFIDELPEELGYFINDVEAGGEEIRIEECKVLTDS